MGETLILFKAVLEGRCGIKKNGKKIYRAGKRLIIASSDNYKAWERTAALQLLQTKAQTQFVLPVSCPINLACRFHFPNHQGEADLSNLYQGIEDLLEKLEIIENDKQIYSHNGSAKLFGSESFKTEIEITAF